MAIHCSLVSDPDLQKHYLTVLTHERQRFLTIPYGNTLADLLTIVTGEFSGLSTTYTNGVRNGLRYAAYYSETLNNPDGVPYRYRLNIVKP